MIDDGQVDRAVSGKTITRALKNGTELILELDDGHQLRIGWADGMTGELIKGEPVIIAQDVRIVLPCAPLFGGVGTVG
jgi:hypothetical protein